MEKGFFTKNKVFGINLLYILSLIPVIIYGFYKNGIIVANHNHLSWFLATQYIVIPIIIIVLSYVFETYYHLGIKKEDDSRVIWNSITPYINALCYLVCGPTNFLWLTIPLIIVLDCLLKFLDNKISLNQVALFKCILFGILTIMGLTNNANLYEASLTSPIAEISALFIGKGIGEIGTTSTLCALIGYAVLLFNNYYKKEIPLFCVIGYSIVSIIMYFVGGLGINELLVNTFTSGFIFASIFVISLSTSTPVIKSGRIIYALIVGALCAITVNILHFNVGIYIITLVIGLLSPILNKFKISLD